MRDLLRLIEQANVSGKVLYHTTSGGALLEILENRFLKPKSYEAFVSLSEKPLPMGDIQGSDCTIGFRAEAFVGQTLKVEYNEDWFDEHHEQAAYIAGEGWVEQYQEPDEAYDEDGFADDEELEADYRYAELHAFEDKHAEAEHISLKAGQPISFDLQDVIQLILHEIVAADDLDRLKQELSLLGYSHVTVFPTIK